MPTLLQEWRGFSRPARRYLLMQLMAGSLMIGYVIYPAYLKSLGLNIVSVGALYSCAEVARCGGALLVGRWLDGRGARTGIALDWLLSGIACGIYAAATRFWHLLAGEMVEKISGLFEGGFAAYENEAYEEKQRERIYAYHKALPYLPQVVLFPLVAFWLVRSGGGVAHSRLVIATCAVGMAGISLYAARCLPNLGVLPAAERQPLWASIPRSLGILVGIELLVNACIVAGSDFVVAFLVLERFRGTVLEVVLIHVAGGLITLAATALTRNWNARFSHRQLICGGIGAMVAGDALVLASRHVTLLFAAYALLVGGCTIWFVQHQALKMRLVPEGRRNEFHTAVLSLRNLTGMPLPLLTGVLAGHLGMKAPFALQMAGWLLVGVAYARFLAGGKPKTP